MPSFLEPDFDRRAADEVSRRVPDLEDTVEAPLLARPNDLLTSPRKPDPHGFGPAGRNVSDAESESDPPRRPDRRIGARRAGTTRH